MFYVVSVEKKNKNLNFFITILKNIISQIEVIIIVTLTQKKRKLDF